MLVINPKMKHSGFTLVEMAMCLIIVGLLLSSAFYVYSLYLIKQQETKTLQAISIATSALYEFKNTRGRYPCPAPLLELKDTSPNYGRETDCADPNIGTATIVPPGTCLLGATPPNNYNGICVESGPRVILGVNPRVRVGAIPFRQLQIDEKDTIDGYGSRLVYAVTETMAVADTYKDTQAGIEIQDGAGNILSGGAQSVAFVVLSPGKNKNGAVNVNGIAQPCLTTATDIDGANCRDFTSTTNTQAIYVMDSKSSGTNQFDDIVEYYVPTTPDVWRRETNTSENIIDLSEDKVGVGIISPIQLTDDLTIKQSTLDNQLDMNSRVALTTTNGLTGLPQSGALRIGQYDTVTTTHSGKILSDTYCTEGGDKCFTVDRIAGAYDNDATSGTSGMGCTPNSGEYMVGIQNGRAKCARIKMACPSGLIMSGVNPDGTPKCDPPVPGCPATTRTLCGTPLTLAAGGNGQGYYLEFNPPLSSGACPYSLYECLNQTWHYRGFASNDNSFACNYSSTNPPTGSEIKNCSEGYSGTYTQNYYKNCTGWPQDSSNNAAQSCTCIGLTTPIKCPSNQMVVGSKERTCTNNILNPNYSIFKDTNGNVYSSEPELLTAKCSCNISTYWEFDQCGSGRVRKDSPTPASFASPTDFWPKGKAFGKYRKRTVNPMTCTYDETAYNEDNCTCDPTPQFRDQNPDCGSCQKVKSLGKVKQIRSGTNCDWIDDPNTSGNTEGECEEKKFAWTSLGTRAGESNPLAEGRQTELCGTTCSCADSGNKSERPCAESDSTNWNYYNSTCKQIN